MRWFYNICDLLRRIRRLEALVAATNDITYISDDYAVTASDGTIIVDSSGGPIEITLPPAGSIEGHRLTFKRVPSLGSDVTITAQPGELIDQASDFVMTSDWSSISMRATADGFILTASYN